MKPREFYSQLQPYEHHIGFSKYPIYTYSFSLNPDKFQPSGACNMSRVKLVEFELELVDPELSLVQRNQPGKNTTRKWEYIVDFYIIKYNILKIMGGLGGLVFAN